MELVAVKEAVEQLEPPSVFGGAECAGQNPYRVFANL